MISIIYFTSYGEEIAYKLKQHFKDACIFNKNTYKGNLENIFNNSRAIIFISSAGIAVRIVSKFLKSKYQDPAVLVIDDAANFVISLISGHIGGANELCREISHFLSATPVITTSTDIHNIYAVDLFAKKNNMIIENIDNLKLISTAMIEKKEIDLIKDIDVDYDYRYKSKNSNIALYITYKRVEEDRPHLILRPKVLNVGIGLRRGVDFNTLYNSLLTAFFLNNLSINSIKAVASYELKRDEEALWRLKERLNVPLIFFKKEEIDMVDCDRDEFVFKSVGVMAVSEPCAKLLGGRLIVKKFKKDGVTISICLEE
ncbi:MAG: hypothetical protein KatS3mg079_108 [Caloramator sp.]|nr:MAG: hypothetical protein KatS3mg079_108 [Caloramator sp.]